MAVMGVRLLLLLAGATAATPVGASSNATNWTTTTKTTSTTLYITTTRTFTTTIPDSWSDNDTATPADNVTTPATAAATIVRGSMSIQVADADVFIADSRSWQAVREGIADVAQVSSGNVTVTLTNGGRRRLRETLFALSQNRRLAGTIVIIDYEIEVSPEDITAIASNLGSATPSQMRTALNAKLSAAGAPQVLAVLSMSVQSLGTTSTSTTSTTYTTTTTTYTMTPTTSTTQTTSASPALAALGAVSAGGVSVGVILLIVLSVIAFMSFAFASWMKQHCHKRNSQVAPAAPDSTDGPGVALLAPPPGPVGTQGAEAWAGPSAVDAGGAMPSPSPLREPEPTPALVPAAAPVQASAPVQERAAAAAPSPSALPSPPQPESPPGQPVVDSGQRRLPVVDSDAWGGEGVVEEPMDDGELELSEVSSEESC